MGRPKIRFRSAPQSYSQAKKTRVLAYLEEERIKGTPVVDIVKGCGVSQATLYRWLRATDIRPLKWRGVCAAKLNTSISRLCRNEFRDRWALLESIFTFSTWLHWPSDIEHIPMGVTSMLSLYALKTEGKAFVSELSSPAQKAICRNMLLHDFANIGMLEHDFPIFRDDELDGQPYTMRELIGEGTGCLLSMASEKDRRFAPSLGKINYLMRNNVFRYKWGVGRVTLEKAWTEHLPAAPFFYIDTFHSGGLDWVLYPDSHLFVLNIDAIVAQVARFPGYFSRCKAAASALAAALPKGRKERLFAPTFPKALSEEPTKPPPLTDAIKRALAGYKSADR